MNPHLNDVHHFGSLKVHSHIFVPSGEVVPKNPARFHAPGLLSYLAGLSQGTEVFRMAEERFLLGGGGLFTPYSKYPCF